MSNKLLALALLVGSSVATGACTAPADDADPAESTEALTSFSSIENGGACASPNAGRTPAFRSSYVRVRFEKTAVDDLAHIEWFDSATGLREMIHTYAYKKKGSDVQLYSPDTVDNPFVMYTLHNETDGSVTLKTLAEGDQIKVTCDLKAGAPKLTIPVTPALRTPKSIGATGFPAPPANQGHCLSTKLVNGSVLRLATSLESLESQYPNKFSDPHFSYYNGAPKVHHAALELYAHGKFGVDLLENAEVALIDQESKFGLEVVGPAGNHPKKGYSYGEIVAKTVAGKRVLVLTPTDEKLRTALGTEVELSCDY